MKVKKSVIWKYFTVVDEDYAKCIICNKNYSRKGRTTTSLKGHLRSMHQNKFDEFCLIDELQRHTEQSDVTLTASQKIITHQVAVENIQRRENLNNEEVKKVDKLIGEMLALHNLPFTFVNGIGFRRLIQATLPHYELKSSNFFTDYVCDELYSKMFRKIKAELDNLITMSLSIDIFSKSSDSLSMASYTAHGVTKDFQRVHYVLKCYSVHGPLTSSTINKQIRTLLNEFNIKTKNIHCIISNSHSDTKNQVKFSNVSSINCTIDLLQQCVHAALEISEVKDLILKCRQISAHFNESRKAKEQLHSIQTEQLSQSWLEPIEDCDKRMNSTYFMVERLINIKESLCMYAILYDIPQITAEEWLNLSIIMTVLSPFEEIIRILSDSTTSISSVIPLIHVLKHVLCLHKDKLDKTENFNNKIINELIQNINFNMGEIQQDYLYALATYLDPRYKTRFFNEIVKSNVESELLRLLAMNDEFSDGTKDFEGVFFETDSDDDEFPVDKKLKVEPDTSNDEPSTSSHFDASKSILHSLDRMMSNISDDEDTTNMSQKEKWKLLINDYNKRKRIKSTEDPLLWWKVNSKFQAFLPIVRAFLSAPAGTTQNKQLRDENCISNCLENDLESDKLEKFMLVKRNLLLLDFDY